MASEPLSEQLIEAGAAVLGELDRIGLCPNGVLWLHFAHLNDWRLTVVSDLVEAIGRRKVYDLLGSALDKIGPIDGLTIFDLHLASSTEIMPRVLGGTFTVNNGRTTIRNSTVNGLLVDAEIYRLLPPRPESDVKAAARVFERTVKKLPAIV